MISIDYPKTDFRIRKDATQHSIFDPIRKQWVVLTPEEWVRQNFIQFLVQRMQIPMGWIAVEKSLQLGEMMKRFDLLVFDQGATPWLLIECKAEGVSLEASVFEQALRYSIVVPAVNIVTTNGSQTRLWHRVQDQWVEQEQFLIMPISQK